MKSKRLNLITAIFAIAVYVVLGTIFFVGWLFVLGWDAQIELNESTRTSVNAEVITKDSYTVPDGTTLTKKYKATVNIDGEEFDINLPSNVYDNVEIGDTVEVTISSKDDEIRNVTFEDFKNTIKTPKE